MTAILDTHQSHLLTIDPLQQLEEMRTLLSEKDNQFREQQKAYQALQEAHQVLQEQIEWFKRQIFGRKSEKQCTDPAEVLYLPNLGPTEGQTKQEGNSEEVAAEKEQTKKKRKKRQSTFADSIKLPKDIPTEEVYLDLPEEEKICPITGEALVKIGEEVSTRLCKRVSTFYLKRFIRPKYVSPQKEADQPIITTELPNSFLPGANVDESVLADLCVSKYGDHQPLNRIAEIWGRTGVEICRQTLNKWVLKCAEKLSPLLKLMCKEVMQAKAVYIDESPIKLLRHKKGKAKGKAHQAYGWMMTAEVRAGIWYSVYHFKTSREHRHAETLLAGYKGYVHTDKYEAYEKLAKRGMKWCPCWVHIRRNFIEATTGAEVRDHILSEIGRLFELEKEAWSLPKEERCKFRREKEEPLIDALLEVVKKRIESGKDLKKSKMAQALNYFYSLKPHLKRYMESPHTRLDNNPVERQIRPVALGRKNWLFLGSLKGAEAAEVLFSLVQSCRSIGVNPTEYLEDVMRRIDDHPYNRLAELLPDRWAKEHNPDFGGQSSVRFSLLKKRSSSPSVT